MEQTQEHPQRSDLYVNLPREDNVQVFTSVKLDTDSAPRFTITVRWPILGRWAIWYVVDKEINHGSYGCRGGTC
jgi:hypothetical protein